MHINIPKLTMLYSISNITYIKAIIACSKRNTLKMQVSLQYKVKKL